MLVSVKLQIPDILLIIAGEGPARKSLQKYTRKLNLTDNVMFVGYMSREQALLDCYRAGQAFVFASRTETQGLVLLEALACGLPVISTAVMGTLDVLDGQEGGCLIADEDVDDFSGKSLNFYMTTTCKTFFGIRPVTIYSTGVHLFLPAKAVSSMNNLYRGKKSTTIYLLYFLNLFAHGNAKRAFRIPVYYRALHSCYFDKLRANGFNGKGIRKPYLYLLVYPIKKPALRTGKAFLNSLCTLYLPAMSSSFLARIT